MPKHVDFLCVLRTKLCINGGMNFKKYTGLHRKTKHTFLTIC